MCYDFNPASLLKMPSDQGMDPAPLKTGSVSWECLFHLRAGENYKWSSLIQVSLVSVGGAGPSKLCFNWPFLYTLEFEKPAWKAEL